MSLRFKLLLIALSTLALPVAGWLFVRQMEELLRQGQEQTLIASANALARSLTALQAELPPSGPALYVHRLTTSITVDGYADDWAAFKPYAQNLGPANAAQKLQLLLAADRDWLYLLAQVRDSTRTRADARDANVAISDHLTLLLERNGLTRRYLIASAAPGAFDAVVAPDDAGSALPVSLGGQWQEDSSGYRVELRLPRAQLPDRLALSVYDAANPAVDSFESRPLLMFSPQLSADLAPFAPNGARARLLSADGWVIAQAGKLDNGTAAPGSRRRGLENLVYRQLIAPGLANAQDFAPALPRLNSAEIWQALSGVAATAWHPAESEEQVVLAAAVPLTAQGEVRGALLLEQAGDALPLLTNRALLSLVGASLAALLVAGGVLFAFASVLSLRIRRLRNAAEHAVRTGGRLDQPLPLLGARDELGDLSRSFAKLLDEVAAYTEYLRTLASKLSHELHTPLAIVKSSLDNLDHQSIPAAAQPYIARARDGAERLGAILRAMSESSRMERAIAAADGEDFDLAAVVRGCVEAYRPLAAPRTLQIELPAAPVPMHGAPELVAQALDKLFDNARGFTPEDGWIRVCLQLRDDCARIVVANRGPPLPESMQERLFDSLVSMREAGPRARIDAPHLGLGLYVVRLIAELHRGSASARNLPDASGVEFTLFLRGMPRKRLVGDSTATR